MGNVAAWDYAQATVSLPEIDGNEAAAVFDMALTNGLVAIVGHDWPAQLHTGKRVKSARQLLDVIDVEVGVDASGWATAPRPDGTMTRIAVRLFRDALDRTQPVRHGRGGDGRVSTAEVEALCELDHHPALRRLSDAAADRRSEAAVREDAVERARAQDYLGTLSEAEVARRVPLAEEGAPFDPKDHLDWSPPQECPVCWNETLVVDGLDDYGHGIGVGTCTVCSYRRSRSMVDELALDAEFARWAAD